MTRTRPKTPNHALAAALAGAIAGAALLVACGPETDVDPAPESLTEAQARSSGRPLRGVLAAKLASFGVVARTDDETARELRDDTGTMPRDVAQADDPGLIVDAPPVDLDPELVELRDGLVGMVVRDPRQLALARADVENLADEMVPVLVAGLRDRSRAVVDLKVLADFAAAVPRAQLALALVDVASDHDDAWMRRYAAWSLLPHAGAPGADAVVPALLRRLKYERDLEGFVWVAAALAAFENHSGLPALFDLAARPPGDPVGDAARSQVAVIVAASGVESGDALWASWSAGERGRTADASDGLRAELWLLVADLSGEHFQLRGVDDARHVLSRLGPWAGAELAQALEDEDDYVRLHVAQCLERMGPRGRLAIDSLTASLGDRSDAVAGAASEALVAVAGASAQGPLLERLASSPPHAVKVALIRALGRVPQAPVERLLSEFQAAGAAADLRLAAAEGLVRNGRASDVLPWLAEALTDRFGDPAGAEALAESWVDATSEEANRAQLREAWQALAPPGAVIHNGDQVRERRRKRAQLLADFTPRTGS